MKLRLILFALGLILAPSIHAAINWTATQSSLAITDDFESYSPGPISAPMAILGGTTGESFVGQSVATGTGFDVVTGTPSNPLTVAASSGEAEIYIYGDNTLVGMIPGQLPDGIGEGAVSFVFDEDHTEMGIAVLGAQGSGGAIDFQFFDRTGASVGTASIPNPADGDYTLTSDGAAFAGVTISNTDPGGVTYDDLRIGEGAPPTPATPVPTLSTWAIYLLVAMVGLLGWFGVRRIVN